MCNIEYPFNLSVALRRSHHQFVKQLISNKKTKIKTIKRLKIFKKTLFFCYLNLQLLLVIL